MIYRNTNDLVVEADMSVIPSHTLTFCENALYIAEAIERDYNKLFQEIGIHELAVYEATGEEIVYEAEEKASIKEKIIGFFKKIWAKIKAGFEAILIKFQSLNKEVRDRVPKITKSMVLGCSKSTFGKTHKFNVAEKSEEYLLRANDFVVTVKDEFTRLANNGNTTKEDAQEKRKELEEKICDEVSGMSGISTVSDMTKKIHKDIVGDEVEATKEYVADNVDEMVKVVKDNSTKDTIKKNYKDFKKIIDDVISQIKKTDDKGIGVINHQVYVIKEIVNAANAANNVVMDACKRRFSEYRNILLRVSICIQNDKKGSKTKATGESAAPDTTADQVQLIESLFTW